MNRLWKANFARRFYYNINGLQHFLHLGDVIGQGRAALDGPLHDFETMSVIKLEACYKSVFRWSVDGLEECIRGPGPEMGLLVVGTQLDIAVEEPIHA